MNNWYKVSVTRCTITAQDSVFVSLDSTFRPVIKQEGNSLKAPDASSYQWYREGKLIEGAGSKSLRVDKAGYYTLKVFNSTGCENVSSPYFYVPVSSVEEKMNGRIRIKCSPNPTRGVFSILFSEIPSKPAKVTVYDSNGKRFMVGSIQDHVNRFDLSRLSKGLFFVEIIMNTERRVIPVLVQ
jgi:hypothetical protein